MAYLASSIQPVDVLFSPLILSALNGKACMCPFADVFYGYTWGFAFTTTVKSIILNGIANRTFGWQVTRSANDNNL